MTIWQHSLATWRAILSDKGAVLLLFVAGIIYSFFYPLPYQYEQVEAVPVIVVDQDSSSSSRTLQRLLLASPHLDIHQLGHDTADIQHALWQGDVMALIIIPSGFHRELLSGRQAEIQIASHGGYLLAGSKALVGANQAALTMAAGISMHKQHSQGDPAIAVKPSQHHLQLHSRPLYNEREGYGHSVVPGVLVLVLQQTLLIGVTLLLGRQAEQGTLAQGYHAYFGMLLTFSLIAFINSLYFFLVALRLQHYTQASDLLALLSFCLLFSISVAAFALLLGRAFKSRERGLQLLLVTAVPMLFLAGYSWPAESLPTALFYLRWLLPATAGIHGFVSINQLGASLADIQTELLALFLLTSMTIPAGLWCYRQAQLTLPTAKKCP